MAAARKPTSKRLSAAEQVAELVAMSGAEGTAAERSMRELLTRAQHWKLGRGGAFVERLGTSSR